MLPSVAGSSKSGAFSPIWSVNDMVHPNGGAYLNGVQEPPEAIFQRSSGTRRTRGA